MENNGWVKLHRKAKENGMMGDHLAWTLFCWILMSVDRKSGKYLTGRYLLAEALETKPTTIYHAILRLSKKWKVVTLRSDNKKTEISVLNWAKYQSTDSSVTQVSDIKVTTKEQQSDTIQEVENIEVKNNNANALYAAEKTSNNLVLSKSQLIAFAREFPGITTTEIREQREKCNSYMAISSSSYTNPGLFFKGWLKKYTEDKKNKAAKEKYNAELLAGLPPLSPEEKERANKKLAEIREKLHGKFSIARRTNLSDEDINKRRNELLNQAKQI